MTEPLSMDQAFIRKLTNIVLANLSNEKFGASDLAKEAGMSRTNLYRKLRSIKHQDIVQFIQEIRLQCAMEMLLNKEASVSEIAYRVGFGSPAYFTRCFHKYYGYTPGEVKRRETVSHDFGQTDVDHSMSVSHLEKHGIGRFYSTKNPGLKKILIASTGTLIGLGLILFFYFLVLKSNKYQAEPGLQDPVKSIVILPFKNLSDDPENQYFADGIMENILNNLYQIRKLKVISRTTSEQLRVSTLSATEIGDKLKVNFILEGSVQKQSNAIRINVQLIDARTDQHLWSGKYDRDMKDVFAVQSDIAFQIANNLKATLTIEEIGQIAKAPTESIEAYSNYLYGRFFLNKNPQKAILEKSIGYFEKSLDADSDFALAYAGMARAYMFLAHYGLVPWEEGRRRTKELALEALNIDKSIADAHCVLGNLARYEFKWKEAMKEFLLAMDYERDNPTAYDGYGMILSATGKLDEARKYIEIAKELNPLSLEVLETSALFYLNEGKVNEMGDELRKMHEIDSSYNHAHRIYYNYYFIKGDTLNAIKTLKKACDTDPVYSKYGTELMNTYNNSGFKAAIEFWLKAEIEINNPIFIAAVCIYLDRKDEALTWLERACEEQHSMIYNINYAWPFKSLRSEPRFQAIIEKMGLSKYVKDSSTVTE